MAGWALAVLAQGPAAAAPASTTPLSVNWYHEGKYLQAVIDEFTRDAGIDLELHYDAVDGIYRAVGWKSWEL